MAEIPLAYLRHRVTVEPAAGTGPHGPLYGPAVTGVRAYVEDKRRLIRGRDGSEVVSMAVVWTRLAVVAPEGSRVTLPDGRQGTVASVARYSGGGWPTPDHQQLTLI